MYYFQPWRVKKPNIYVSTQTTRSPLSYCTPFHCPANFITILPVSVPSPLLYLQYIPHFWPLEAGTRCVPVFQIKINVFVCAFHLWASAAKAHSLSVRRDRPMISRVGPPRCRTPLPPLPVLAPAPAARRSRTASNFSCLFHRSTVDDTYFIKFYIFVDEFPMTHIPALPCQL